jgi:hypothetical protein
MSCPETRTERKERTTTEREWLFILLIDVGDRERCDSSKD